jgi:hypothetical protein
MQQLRGEVERRVGDHAERAGRQAEGAQVGLDDAHWVGGEPGAQRRASARMELYGYNPGTGPDQVRGQRPFPGAEVEHELTRPDARAIDDPRGPCVGQRMPAPVCRGHGGPP